MNTPHKDMSGMRFGSLVAVSAAGKSNGRMITWLCNCDCGTSAMVNGKSLRSGDTKSCGCLQVKNATEQGKKNRKRAHKDAARWNQYCSYINNSKNTNRLFSLSEDEFECIVSKKCYYCGEEPKEKMIYGSGSGYFANGIDRVDSSIGYDINNCVPCCFSCNSSKSAKSQGEFIKMCQMVSKIHGSRS